MKRIEAFIAVLIVSALSLNATERNVLQGIISRDALRDALVTGQAWVPYPAYADRGGWDRLTGSCKADVIAQGEKYLAYEWKVVKAMDYIDFEVSGDRGRMEDPMAENNRAIASLMAAELAEGKGRFIPQMINGIFHSCELTSWAISAHLASLSASRRSLPEPGDNTLELFQGGMSQMMSWAYYFFKDEFDKVQPEISRRLRKELQYREIDAYLTKTDPWWMGFEVPEGNVVNNWNPWCNSNAIICFMLLENDPEVLLEGVWKTILSVDRYLNYINFDGALDEGPNYWAAASGKLFEYLAALDLATAGKFKLFEEPGIKAMGEFIINAHIGDGWVVNFADASPRTNYSNTMLIYRYGKAVGSDLMKGYAAKFFSQHPNVPRAATEMFQFFESLRCMDELKSAPREYEEKSYVWYPETQFHFERSDGGLFFAAKAGHNFESHNHNDVGNFVLYADNKPLFVDAGVGTYTRQTFSGERYSIWSMQSGYHNLPLIGGVAQLNGRSFKGSSVHSSKGFFSVDIAGAYPENAGVKSWVRSYKLGGKSLEISDKFILSKRGEPNQLVFMSMAMPFVEKPGKIVLDGTCASMSYDSKTFVPEIETIEISDRKLGSPWHGTLYRIHLKARKNVLSGTYKCIISIE